MKEKNFHPLTILVCSVIFFSCQKDLARRALIANNKAPVASAGRDAIIVLPLDSIMLDGSHSNDPDGKIETYLWTKISGSGSCAIDQSKDSSTIAKNLIHGIYRFELTITDNGGLSAKDTLMVTVDSAANSKHSPIVDAGPDKIITLPTNSVLLDGSNSIDPDNNISAYQWANISGPSSFNIANANAVQTSVSALIEGIYQFELKVTDNEGLTGTDTVQVTVNNSFLACGRPVINVTLQQIGSLSVGRGRLVAGAAGNKILFVGGDSSTAYGGHIATTRVDIYDIVANTWSTTEIPRGLERHEITVASVGNKILFAGGRGDWEIDAAVASTTSTVNIFDVSTNSWSEAHLSQARTGMATATLGSKVYFAGGGYRNPVSPDFWVVSDVIDIYDNVTSTWSTATLSEGRSNLSAAVVGNKIFFAGGNRLPGSYTASTRIDIFDAATNSWSVSNLLEPRSDMAGIGAGGDVFWASGSKSFSISGFIHSRSIEMWDIASGTSTSVCTIPRERFHAVATNDNIIFFTGYGSDGRSGTEIDIYNISTNTWSTGVMNLKIFDAAIISVNNTIYVAGGSFTGSAPFYNQVWKLEF